MRHRHFVGDDLHGARSARVGQLAELCVVDVADDGQRLSVEEAEGYEREGEKQQEAGDDDDLARLLRTGDQTGKRHKDLD